MAHRYCARGGNNYRTKVSPRSHHIALAESQHHVVNPTNPGRALDDGVEDRLHVRRRAADDPEHLGRRSLMLQRLAQFRIALLQFFEQADVFNCYHGLVREGLEKSDLLVGKGVNLQATNQNSPDCNSFTEQWRSQPGPNSIGPARAQFSGNSAFASGVETSWTWIVLQSIMALVASSPPVSGLGSDGRGMGIDP